MSNFIWGRFCLRQVAGACFSHHFTDHRLASDYLSFSCVRNLPQTLKETFDLRRDVQWLSHHWAVPMRDDFFDDLRFAIYRQFEE